MKLTDKIVREMPPPATGNRIAYDEDVGGFGVRVTAGDVKSFVLNYRFRGRERRYTIGRFPAWRVSVAREEAAKLKRDIDRGSDPVAEREAQRSAPTVAEAAERYLVEHAAAKKKPRSIEEDARNLRLHVQPALGNLPIASVTRDDIAKLHADMSGSPVGANRVLSLLSKLFSLCEVWGLRSPHTNPCRGVDRYPERARERLVTAEEMARLGDALSAYRGYWAGPAAIRLLMLTGMRKAEVLGLQWAEVSLELGRIRLEDSKTGPKTIPIGAPALSLLAGLPRTDSPYVLPAYRPRRRGGAPATHFRGVQEAWMEITKAAGIEGLRLHDLRHGFASIGAIGGDSLFVLGKLLGHRDQATSARYAHLSTDPLRPVVDRISGQVAALLEGKPAQLIKLRR